MCVRCFPHVTEYFDSSRLNFFTVQGMFAECLPYPKGTYVYPRKVPMRIFVVFKYTRFCIRFFRILEKCQLK